MRASGAQVRAIAAALDISEKTVSRVIGRRLAELNQSITQDTAGLRAGHLLELQGLRDRLRPVLTAGDPGHRIGAVKAWLALLQRESQLLGLDAPAAIELHARTQASTALLQHLELHLSEDCLAQVVDALAVEVSHG